MKWSKIFSFGSYKLGFGILSVSTSGYGRFLGCQTRKLESGGKFTILDFLWVFTVCFYKKVKK